MPVRYRIQKDGGCHKEDVFPEGCIERIERIFVSISAYSTLAITIFFMLFAATSFILARRFNSVRKILPITLEENELAERQEN